MHNILHDKLVVCEEVKLWVPKLLKLLSEEQKKEKVRICTDFVSIVHCHSMSMLDNIVMMDETMVSYHTPEAMRQSKQRIKKGLLGPVKARHLQANQAVVLWFFDSKELVYTHIVPNSITINANYTEAALDKLPNNSWVSGPFFLLGMTDHMFHT
jgi:hypothetical protein